MENTDLKFTIKVEDAEVKKKLNESKKIIESTAEAARLAASEAKNAGSAANGMGTSFTFASKGTVQLTNNLEGVAIKMAAVRQSFMAFRQVAAPVFNELDTEGLTALGVEKDTAKGINVGKSILGNAGSGAMYGMMLGGPKGALIGAGAWATFGAGAEIIKAHKEEAKNIEERRQLLAQAKTLGNAQVSALENTLRNYQNSLLTTREFQKGAITEETSRLSLQSGLGNTSDPAALLKKVEEEKANLQRMLSVYTRQENADSPALADAAKETASRIAALNQFAAEAVRLATARRALEKEDAAASLALFKSQQAIELETLETTYAGKTKEDKTYLNERLRMLKALHAEEAKLDTPDNAATNANLRKAQVLALTRQLKTDGKSAIGTHALTAARETDSYTRVGLNIGGGGEALSAARSTAKGVESLNQELKGLRKEVQASRLASAKALSAWGGG